VEEPCLVVLITAPRGEKAVSLARALVEARVAACVNVLDGVRSIYRWEGEVQDDGEALLVAKTTRASFEALKAKVLELHEYSCPEVVALPIERGHEAYLRWLGESVAR